MSEAKGCMCCAYKYVQRICYPCNICEEGSMWAPGGEGSGHPLGHTPMAGHDIVPPTTIKVEMPTVKADDSVNHPSHYTQGGIECIDAIKAATTGLEGIEAVCTANAIKYLWRWKYKNGVQDIDKAIWYLERLRKEVDHATD